MAHQHTARLISLFSLLLAGVARGQEPLNLVTAPELAPHPSPAAPASAATPAATPAGAQVPPARADSPGARAEPARLPGARAASASSAVGKLDRLEGTSRRVGPFLNTGMYLRMSLGFGATNDVVGTASSKDDDGDRSAVTGIGTVGEVLLGAPVTPELVFGGGLWLSSMSTSSYFYDQGTPLPEVMQRPRDFALLGPYVDWYFARRPGLHAQGGLGFALLTGSGWARGKEQGSPAFGGGLSAAFGYDSWIAESWKLGVLARITTSVLAEREGGQTWIHTMTGFPALLVSATYN